MSKDRKRQLKRRTRRFPKIGLAAEKLNVSREHLWSVLMGRRQSRRLMARAMRWRQRNAVEWAVPGGGV